ncbi:hypothetical protein BJ912DRAFT_1124672 [Pholiota molesta]|nr:hypothetical protein BJ912DRAFT_1124672 [Pholiota molesta]
MSPQRVADAASISPYPFVVRQERQPSSASPENTERSRPPKGKKAKVKAPRVVQEEEPRFNTGPRVLRPKPGPGARRGFRFPGRAYPEDQNGIPDYPPPSFQEAINTPPLSVTSSTTSLIQPCTIPLVIPQDIPEHPEEPTNATEDSPEPATTCAAAVDDNGSDSDESMFIIERNSVPVCSTDLPRGAELTKRIKYDWMSRRGVEFPEKPNSESSKRASGDADNAGRGRRGLRPPPLDISSKVTLVGPGGSSPVSTPKRRFLSLSPLRTIFPTKSPAHEDRAMSAHPSPSLSSTSPYSMSRSTFFRSTSSLATSLLPMLPLSSSHKSENLSRKIFASKSKDRNKPSPEHLDAWEVLEEENYPVVDQDGFEHPTSLMSAVATIRNLGDSGTSPTRSQSFSFGTHVPHSAPPATRAHYQHSLSRDTIHEGSESSLRDWKGPSTAFIDRPLQRRTPTSPSMVSIVSGTTSTLPSAPMSTIDLSLPLAPLRARPTSPSPAPSLAYKHTAHVVHSSPLRVDARPIIKIDNHEVAAIYQKALETPLPATPDYRTPWFDPVAVGTAALLDPRDTPTAYSMSASISAPFQSQTSPQLTISVTQQLLSSSSSSSLGALNPVTQTDSLEEPMTPTRHHYAGRPLPRPPPTTAGRVGTIDSTYASAENSAQDGDRNARLLNSCPEGLLIDLEDTTLDDIPASGASTPRSEDDRFYSQLHLPTMSRNTSSVDLIRTNMSGAFSSALGTSTPLRSSPGPSQPPQGGGFSELTDFDLLVSGLNDRDHDGTDYEVSYGNNGWRERGLNGNKQPDVTSSLRVNWAREPTANAHAGLRVGHLPETYTQPQRQHISHWAH